MINKSVSTLLMVVAFIVVSIKAVKAAGSSSLYALYTSAISKAFGWVTETQSISLVNIINAFDNYGDQDANKLIYIIATAYHESKLAPVREIRAKPGTALYTRQEQYWNTGYYGRGYVQLTHERNYKVMGEAFGIDLLNNPDKALDPVLAANILVYGMINGSFTGRRLSQYINQSSVDFVNARRVVNSLDQAFLIRDYADLIKGNINVIAA